MSKAPVSAFKDSIPEQLLHIECLTHIVSVLYLEGQLLLLY